MAEITSKAMVLGTLPFGSILDSDASRLIISEAWELGVRAFDVASLYGNGNASEILGSSLRGKTEKPIFCCSIGLEEVADKNGVFAVDVIPLSPTNIIKSVDGLLVKLQSDYIDVLNIHAPNPRTPLTETLGTLKHLQQIGKIGRLSYSNISPEYLDNIQAVCLALDMKIDRIQFHGNLLEQRLIREFCEAKYNGLELFCYRPLARGLLTREYSQQNPKPQNSRASRGWRLDSYLKSNILKHVESFNRLSMKTLVPKTQLALTWLFEIARVNGIVFGVRTVEQLREIFPYWQDRVSFDTINQLRAYAEDLDFEMTCRELPITYFEK